MHTEAINRAANTTAAAATQDRHHIALRETGRRSGGGMMERVTSGKYRGTALFTSLRRNAGEERMREGGGSKALQTANQ